jgi:hypothetical protein
MGQLQETFMDELSNYWLGFVQITSHNQDASVAFGIIFQSFF